MTIKQNQIEIIPTNFALDEKTFNEKLEKLNFAKKIHLDYMDGRFTELKSINIKGMKIIKDTDKFYEIHLMAYNPLKYLEEILKLGIKKVLIQIEVFKNKEELKETIKKFKEKRIELFIVLNPETKIEIIQNYEIEKKIDGIMLMSVHPGREGQEFIEETYNKIRYFKQKFPKLKLQIDGGINIKNIKKLKEMNINIISIGSYISSNKNPENNYKKLKKIINS